MSLTLIELRERVAREYDPVVLVDILDITSEELLVEFEDKLLDKRKEFAEYDER
jgi:hypothetical protein